MPRKFTVPVIRTIQDIYIVEANSATEAGMIAGARILAEDEPDIRREQSRKVLSAKTLTTPDGEHATD